MVFDNPAPSANGTMLIVLTRLALLTGEKPTWKAAAPCPIVSAVKSTAC